MIKPIIRFISSICICFSVLLLASPAFAGKPHYVRPLLVVGPQAIPFGAASPQYGLFTCQVVGLNPGVTCYDPFQMRHAYGVDSLISGGNDGTGHTIVIVDAFDDPFLAGDLAYFDSFYGLPAANLTHKYPDGTPGFDAGWAAEMTLDVEWAHAIAPGANIVLVHALTNSDADILSAIKYAVDNNLGDVISMSFGENESCVDPDTLASYHDVFVAATQKGITLFASAGDDGAGQPTCDGSALVQAASSPASDPLVSGVGGTELHAARYCFAALGCDPATNPAPGTYQGEIVWNEAGIGATGGGFSVLFDEPPYQKSALKGKQRGVPDVAYNAAVLHGVIVRLFGGWYLFGGTSAGSPQWAAITVITNQKAGGQLGFLNKAFYQVGQVPPAYAASFHDVTTGDNSAFGVAGFAAGPGWDATTGLGSPITASLVDYLIKYVSPGDGQSAISTTKPKPHPKPIVPGSMDPH